MKHNELPTLGDVMRELLLCILLLDAHLMQVIVIIAFCQVILTFGDPFQDFCRSSIKRSVLPFPPSEGAPGLCNLPKATQAGHSGESNCQPLAPEAL